MNFLNLGLGELLGLMGVVSAGVVALYLLDRSKKKQIVATLRFWTPAGSRTDLKHRRRIQQPWSLLLQLLSLLLLLLAIAGPQFGVFDGPGADHVVLIDTSAWMGAVTAQGTVLDQAKTSAQAYINALPRRDRVMLVRADALATPATAFELDRSVVETALRETQSSASALNLGLALDFAERAQALQTDRPGEVVYIGPGRVNATDTAIARYPSKFRVIDVKTPTENVGLRKVALRRSPTAPDSWEIFVAVRNYGVRPHTVDLALQYAQSPAGSRRLVLSPGAEEQTAFLYKEKAAGWLEARININDAIPGDDRAIVEVPSQELAKVIVYSDDALLQPLFASNPVLQTEFKPTSAYDANAKADLIVLDRFAPPSPPKFDTLWIAPPTSGSLIPVKSTQTNAALDRWNQDTPIGAGLYTRDVTLATTEVFSPTPADSIIASTTAGPVIVARDGAIKNVAIGFNPAQGSMKYELATPLLIANVLKWMIPGAYRRFELQAGSVGTTSVPVEANVNPADVHVLDESNRELPYSIEGDTLRFFSGAPGTIRVQTGDRELVYSLTLPALADGTWTKPTGIANGIPPKTFSASTSTEIWPWLAIAGALGLLLDWILFGRNRAISLTSIKAPWSRAA
ncbi:MAG: VWA domain-containing protein [Bryobacteraceae bacterium]